jgi:hypothetical protein
MEDVSTAFASPEWSLQYPPDMAARMAGANRNLNEA